MKRLLLTAAAAIATGALALPGTAAAATPAAATPTCEFTRAVCLWDAAGNRFNVSALNPAVGTCVDLAWHGWGNGRATSGANTGTRTAVLYSNTDCSGGSYQLVPQGQYPSISFPSNSIYVY
ncbi:hypothetical protein J2S43_001774 [Catenuloplanes nepalensis]|uniref:Peptidase inhibitor family I36 n=2 Tax=Catenuloplanes nepalensis TaxID=587533 RepID=A0ABT9MPD1_9ACTN|nr:hypothetical protein [Catenuloplanes nepalensis]